VRVVVLAGGTGGAKLAAGFQDVIGADLTVIANTGDDTEVHGLRVCPDPDLVTYWLAGRIDEERGWGIRGDGFVVHEQLEELGAPGWFRLSDRDLATCLYRTHFLAEGGTLTAAQAQIARALGASATVLPACEEPIRTKIHTPAGERGLQEFLIVDGAAAPIEGVTVDGLPEARPTPEVRAALAEPSDLTEIASRVQRALGLSFAGIPQYAIFTSAVAAHLSYLEALGAAQVTLADDRVVWRAA